MTPDKPSATARLIARSVVFMAHDPKLGHLVPPRAAEASTWFLKATSPHANRLLWLIDRRWFRALVALVEAMTMPGILLHYIVRKRYLEDVARESLGSSTDQVVVLGAGFDTLVLRLCEGFPTATFVEIDHPVTQKIKAQVLQSHRCTNSNLHLLPVDLGRESLTDSLLTYPHYKRDVRTLFVAEGLLMYLEPNAVNDLFRFIARHSGRGSRFAFTFLEPQRKGKVNFRRGSRIIDLWLNWRGEGFRWGIKRQELGSHLAARGLSLHEITGARALRRRYLRDQATTRAHLAQGEYIGVAELKSS
jgi:methyltransferase (TIGR00027 family)